MKKLSYLLLPILYFSFIHITFGKIIEEECKSPPLGDTYNTSIIQNSLLADDAYMIEISSPPPSPCGSDSSYIQIVFGNQGTNTITTMTVGGSVTLGGFTLPLFLPYSGNLPTGGIDTILFGPINTLSGATFNISAFTVLPGDQDLSNDTISIQNAQLFNAQPPTASANDTELCDGESTFIVTQPITTPDPITINTWYDAASGGNIIATGDTLFTGALSNSSSYYLEAQSYKIEQVGPQNNTIGSGGNLTLLGNEYMTFQTFTDLVIDSLAVYPNGAGNVVFNIYDDTHTTLLQTHSFAVNSTGKTMLPVNISLTPGTYTIDGGGTTTGGLYRNTSGAMYPYEVADVISITGNSFDPNYFYWFYDWHITAKGCERDRVGITINVAPNPATTVTPTNVSCSGANDGMISTSTTGGTSFTYMWSNMATTQNVSGLIPGTYNVTVTNEGGCTDTINNIMITEPAPVTTTLVNVDSVTCNGGMDGMIDITPGGGTSYTYIWSNGSMMEDPSGLMAGTYSVTVTNQDGCTDSLLNIVVEEPIAISITSVPTGTLCFGSADGKIDIIPSGGTTFSYLWSNNATTQNITGLTAGSYDVTVTNQDNCSNTFTGLTVNEPTALMLTGNVVAHDSAGLANGSVSVMVTGGTPPYTYLWDNSQISDTATGLVQGNYGVTVTDANNCSDTTSVTIGDWVSTDELAIINSLGIYPNPTDYQTTIQLQLKQPTDLQVVVMNSLGQVLLKRNEGQTANFEHNLDVSNYPSGVYWIRFVIDNRILTKPLVITK